jgi:hypothetical protein
VGSLTFFIYVYFPDMWMRIPHSIESEIIFPYSFIKYPLRWKSLLILI